MNKWWNTYISIPFVPSGRDRNGCDCWGLVRLALLEQKNHELPLYLDYSSPFAKKEVSGLIHQNKHSFVEVQEPHDYDIAVIRTGALAAHVGIVCGGGKFLLETRDKFGTTISRLSQVRHLVESFWRLPA